MAAFPTLPSGALPDSKKYQITLLSSGTSSLNFDGGYTATRSKTTTRIRKEYEVSYTFVSNADKEAIETFWREQYAGGIDFVWFEPSSENYITVRFKGDLNMKQVGIHTQPSQYWDISFVLEEA